MEASVTDTRNLLCPVTEELCANSRCRREFCAEQANATIKQGPKALEDYRWKRLHEQLGLNDEPPKNTNGDTADK